MTEIVLSVIAGLVLFLYAVSNLSITIRNALGDSVEKWILRFTANTVTAIATGVMVTTLLDSSSAVIIIAIVFVNGGFLRFRQAMGIVLGANIGTTFSSQIIALDIGKFSPILLLCGFGLVLLSKSERISQSGKIILYFGVLFFGLYTMEKAFEPLRSDSVFVEWLKRTDQPLTGALIGALVTLIIQSSSATVGMAIILAKKGLLSLAGGIAIMIGAELGTCSDTLLATIGGSRQAIKTGLFHLLFNVISIALGLLFFQPFTHLVAFIGGQAPLERSIANGHMLFNIGGVLIFAWFLPFFERIFDRLIRE